MEIQQKIMNQVENKFWVIFFRRSMMEMSNIIAANNDGVALITV